MFIIMLRFSSRYEAIYAKADATQRCCRWEVKQNERLTLYQFYKTLLLDTLLSLAPPLLLSRHFLEQRVVFAFVELLVLTFVVLNICLSQSIG